MSEADEAATLLTAERPDDGIVVLTLNRPEKRNALSRALREALVERLRSLAADDSARAVVLTGSGETFCAGFDLKELSEGDPRQVFADARGYHHAVYTFVKPLIAAVNGPALAGGMDLALMCDLRVAARSARFGQPQVRMGVPAAYDLLRTLLPEAAARRLCLTGEQIDAEEAERLGLLARVVADGTLTDSALALARGIADTGAGDAMKKQFLASQPPLFEG